MEKKNTGLIVVVVILAICVLGLGGYLVYDKVFSKDNNTNNVETNNSEDQNNTNIEEVVIVETKKSMTPKEEYDYLFNQIDTISEIDLNNSLEQENNDTAIVKNSIKKLIAYTNAEVSIGEGVACMYLSAYFDEIALENGTDALAKLQPHIMECLYNMQYVYVDDGPIAGTEIMSNSQYISLNNYFVSVANLELYDDMFKDYNVDETTEFWYNNAKVYFNQNYRVAYQEGDGFGLNGIFLKENGITKKNNIYEIFIEAYKEDWRTTEGVIKYTGTLKVQVIDNHLKYYPLILSPAND